MRKLLILIIVLLMGVLPIAAQEPDDSTPIDDAIWSRYIDRFFSSRRNQSAGALDPAFAELEFTATHEQGGITFGYAAEWAVTAHSIDELPVIASNPARLTRDQGAVLNEDEFLLRVYPPAHLRTLSIDAHLATTEILQHLLDLNPERAAIIEMLTIGEFSAARVRRPQREFMETFYAARVSESCVAVFALMTNPASTEHFEGLLPYWLATVNCA